MPARMLGPGGVDCEISHRFGEENKTFFIRVWKPLSSIDALKILRGSPKGNVQKEQSRLAVGLRCYTITFKKLHM